MSRGRKCFRVSKLLLVLVICGSGLGLSWLAEPSLRPPLLGGCLRPTRSPARGAVQRLPRSSGKGTREPSRRGALAEWAQGAVQSAGTLVAAAAAFYTGAKVAVFGSPRQPELQGPYKDVGSSLERFAGLRCRVLYPAQRGGKEAPYLSEGRATSDAMAGLVFFPGFLLEHLGYASSGCWEDAAPLSENFPILVYSHGQGGNMDMGTYFLRQIASHGLIVVAVEHQDGSASTGDPANPRPFSLTRGQLGVRFRAQELVQVARALQAPGEAQRYGGNPEQLFVGGHSYGGPTAILAAHAEPALFKGLVLHDPALSSEMPKLQQPVFSVVGDEYAGIPNLVSQVLKVSKPDESQAARPWVGAWHFLGISHGNFVDAPLWAPLVIMQLLRILLIPAAGPFEPAEAHRALARAAADFVRGTGAPECPEPWQRLRQHPWRGDGRGPSKKEQSCTTLNPKPLNTPKP
ncbi:PLA2G7 [Symbiodinium natans]|uniref:1-alkyl-2-acetylglycerophosphocholine esterase n=1 Tax=Symbiodinium natans TaxID=878477 RepID=A0A812MDR7_9DINO|nr:PLA2G7 [Symbiodinium natans]